MLRKLLWLLLVPFTALRVSAVVTCGLQTAFRNGDATQECAADAYLSVFAACQRADDDLNNLNAVVCSCNAARDAGDASAVAAQQVCAASCDYQECLPGCNVALAQARHGLSNQYCACLSSAPCGRTPDIAKCAAVTGVAAVCASVGPADTVYGAISTICAAADIDAALGYLGGLVAGAGVAAGVVAPVAEALLPALVAVEVACLAAPITSAGLLLATGGVAKLCADKEEGLAEAYYRACGSSLDFKKRDRTFGSSLVKLERQVRAPRGPRRLKYDKREETGCDVLQSLQSLTTCASARAIQSQCQAMAYSGVDGNLTELSVDISTLCASLQGSENLIEAICNASAIASTSPGSLCIDLSPSSSMTTLPLDTTSTLSSTSISSLQSVSEPSSTPASDSSSALRSIFTSGDSTPTLISTAILESTSTLSSAVEPSTNTMPPSPPSLSSSLDGVLSSSASVSSTPVSSLTTSVFTPITFPTATANSIGSAGSDFSTAVISTVTSTSFFNPSSSSRQGTTPVSTLIPATPSIGGSTITLEPQESLSASKTADVPPEASRKATTTSSALPETSAACLLVQHYGDSPDTPDSPDGQPELPEIPDFPGGYYYLCADGSVPPLSILPVIGSETKSVQAARPSGLTTGEASPVPTGLGGCKMTRIYGDSPDTPDSPDGQPETPEILQDPSDPAYYWMCV